MSIDEDNSKSETVPLLAHTERFRQKKKSVVSLFFSHPPVCVCGRMNSRLQPNAAGCRRYTHDWLMCVCMCVLSQKHSNKLRPLLKKNLFAAFAWIHTTTRAINYNYIQLKVADVFSKSKDSLLLVNSLQLHGGKERRKV